MSGRGNQIRNSPLLLGLTEDEVQLLLDMAEWRRYGEGDVVVREGTASDCLFILSAGSVDVVREAGRVRLARLTEVGEFFGEMSLIDILPRSADILAGNGTEVAAFPKGELADLFARSPRVQMTLILNIARHLSLRLREADARIVALSSP